MEKKTYTLHEIAAYYKISVKTLYNWLKPIRKELIAMNSMERKRLGILIPKQINFIKKYLE